MIGFFSVPYLDLKYYEAVYYVFQIICILYHGQAAVERAFNVNKEHLVANDLISSYKDARAKYQVTLNEQQKNKKIIEQDIKRKCSTDQLKEIYSKKQKIMSVDRCSILSDELCSKAEEKKDFPLLRMANSQKGIIKQNKEKLCKLQEEAVLKKDKTILCPAALEGLQGAKSVKSNFTEMSDRHLLEPFSN